MPMVARRTISFGMLATAAPAAGSGWARRSSRALDASSELPQPDGLTPVFRGAFDSKRLARAFGFGSPMPFAAIAQIVGHHKV